VANRSEGRPTPIASQLWKNLFPMVKLVLVRWLISAVILSPLILAFLVGGIAGLLALCIILLLVVLALIVFQFAIQFSTLEVVVGGKGTFHAINSSLSLVKKNLFAVLLVDVLLFIIGFAGGAGSVIVQTILRAIPELATSMGPVGLAIGYAVYFVLLFGFYAFLFAAVQTIALPITYYFWKGKAG
jgi:hypothetical protein